MKAAQVALSSIIFIARSRFSGFTRASASLPPAIPMRYRIRQPSKDPIVPASTMAGICAGFFHDSSMMTASGPPTIGIAAESSSAIRNSPGTPS